MSNNLFAIPTEEVSYSSALIGSDNLSIEVTSFDELGYVFVDYTYLNRTINSYVREDCIYLMASEFRYEDFAPIPTPSQVLWNGELIDEDDFPF